MHRIEAYITLAIVFIIVITILYLPILFLLKKKGKNIIRQLSYLGLISSIFLIIFATILFVPINLHPEQYILNLKPFAWLDTIENSKQFIEEKVPNIMMFIPLGIFIPIVFKNKRKLYKTTLIVFMFTFSVEFVQYFIGRSADIDDIITNLLGGIIGYGIFKIFNLLLGNKEWWNKFMDN